MNPLLQKKSLSEPSSGWLAMYLDRLRFERTRKGHKCGKICLRGDFIERKMKTQVNDRINYTVNTNMETIQTHTAAADPSPFQEH